MSDELDLKVTITSPKQLISFVEFTQKTNQIDLLQRTISTIVLEGDSAKDFVNYYTRSQTSLTIAHMDSNYAELDEEEQEEEQEEEIQEETAKEKPVLRVRKNILEGAPKKNKQRGVPKYAWLDSELAILKQGIHAHHSPAQIVTAIAQQVGMIRSEAAVIRKSSKTYGYGWSSLKNCWK